MYAPGTRYCRLLSVTISYYQLQSSRLELVQLDCAVAVAVTISYYQLHSSRLELVQLDCAVAVDVEHLEEVIHLA
jgi:hypothetical protein